MKFDDNKYAEKTTEKLLPYTVFETASLMINENSGFDMKYQINKVHNLKLAAKTVNRVIIEPTETFSFWHLVRWADYHEKYKDGLNLVNGKIVGSYGGGLCQLSNLLFWLFLHTPLTIVERHGHAVESFPSTTEDLPCGTDATINEGWLDLKIRNETDNTFQIEVSFDERFMYGRILSQKPVNTEYTVFNVLSLKARVILLRQIKTGDCVGYSRSFVADRDSQIAILSIGYADGYPRNLSCGKSYVLINGHHAPVIGKICMDLLTVDVTECPNVTVGSIATLIGKDGEEEISAPILADISESITNELLSRMGHRLKVIHKD